MNISNDWRTRVHLRLVLFKLGSSFSSLLFLAQLGAQFWQIHTVQMQLNNTPPMTCIQQAQTIEILMIGQGVVRRYLPVQ